ncbi:two-component sensor histidine kinase [Scopulibacillus daqui]|uniref:histidine kinase n=1 Tax=Scopulibacillus daqui TaxID=1469162 RepID=A0ABS2Q1T8_9BACL|nr:sensor histidine kinase [Scopulibacillus daqui]MBM7645910.1 two-component sensor histidine kinase [Scopulibacillus daqui]
MASHQLYAICKKYTTLSERDIKKLQSIAEGLQMTADLAQASVFIDCLTTTETQAIVAAEAHPKEGPVLYQHSVLEQFVHKSYEPAVMNTLLSGKPTYRNRAITQEGKVVKQSVIPIQNGACEIIGVMVMEQDVSDQIKHEQQLEVLSNVAHQLSETLSGFQSKETVISNIIEDGLFIISANSQIIYANSYAVNLLVDLGNTDEYIGLSIYKALNLPNDINFCTEPIYFKEFAVDHKTFSLKSIRLNENKRFSGAVILVQDMTELREKERQLMVKSTVIKEIHHRVKNNLQTVASLLRLQMRKDISNSSRLSFQECLNRILSIASVHEVLSNTGADSVEAAEMIEKVGTTVTRSAADSSKDINITFKYHEPFFIKSDKAVSLALIVNELIQNSIEHAFKERHTGFIKVELYRLASSIQLIVSDNGIGYRRKDQTPSLGLEIVSQLTKHDLNGTFNIKGQASGTKAVVHFPEEYIIDKTKN